MINEIVVPLDGSALPEQALGVLTEERTGGAAHAIEDAFRQNSGSLVFMATYGRGGVIRSLMGSVAGQVLEDGRAPVGLIRPEAHVEKREPIAVGR